MDEYIEIKGARKHNLKNIDIKIPRNKLTVITGVSGSGKSSLAFDTLFEEGKRRYLMFSDSQFMIDSMPSFESITGLSPTVAVEQRTIRQSNPRSTVGTRTRISNMLATLYAVYGETEDAYADTALSVELFQKYSPKGMCLRCLGSGTVNEIDENLIFADMEVQLKNTFVHGVLERKEVRLKLVKFCDYHGLSLDQPLSSLSEDQLNLFKYGDGGKTKFKGIIPLAYNGRKSKELSDRQYRFLLEAYSSRKECPLCGGTGLNEQVAHTKINGKTITELEKMYINDLYDFLADIKSKKKILLTGEILTKLKCLDEVGLYHLSLSRPVPTLSGGEIQRLFLASYIIAEMNSIIFIFDEPTIGLHEVEKAKLLSIIQNLVTRGNTVVVVEHDESFIRYADYIIDIGPDAGEFGGQRIFQGCFDEFLQCDDSRTAPYLNRESNSITKRSSRTVNKLSFLRIENACLHNLKNISVDIPLGILVGIAGVSGSGKSSLISDTLVPKLKEILKSKCKIEEEEVASDVDVILKGVENISKCIIIDQRPIGRSKTSCPATYTGIFDSIRRLFASTEYAIENGYGAGLFTVNSEGGCPICKGEGTIHYNGGFGNFIDIDCEECGGSGFKPEAISVTIEGKSIKDVLSMSVREAHAFFHNKDRAIENMLRTLERVGMGYIKLGQKTPTISGGESQRIKLAKELGKSSNARNTLYILDEPTTGLSFHDSEKLLYLLEELVEKGNSVIITEHDTAILSHCDYIIEMGRGGGNDGGNIIASGAPEELKENPDSIIGRYLN